MHFSREKGLYRGEWMKTIVTLGIVLLGQADVAYAQCQNATIPIVVSVLVTFLVMCIVFAGILYWLRKKWKKPAYGKDYASGAGFDNPLVVDRKENGRPKQSQEGELHEVVIQPNTSEPPRPTTNHEGYQERAVDVEGLPPNGRMKADHGDGNQVQTVVLNKTTPTNGFNIVADNDGNIFVRDIRKDGPASGKLMEGDIIESVTVFYEGISYEDALNVLSFAAPYKVAISLVRGKNHLMPGMEGNKTDPFVQELQQQLEKRGSSKKDGGEENPVESVKDEDKPPPEQLDEEHKRHRSSSSSSSDGEQAEPRKKDDGENVPIAPTSDDKENKDETAEEKKDEGSE